MFWAKLLHATNSCQHKGNPKILRIIRHDMNKNQKAVFLVTAVIK